MKSILRPFFFAAFAASVLAFASRADADSDTLSYIDENGHAVSAEVTRITGYDEDVTLSESNGTGGRYGVTGNVTLNQRTYVEGNVKLILADGCRLTVGGGLDVPEGNSLTIYGQEDGSGQLRATGANGAGIGGSVGADGGTITICGGTVTAYGPDRSAGIGGGEGGNGGTIAIRGGTVTAYGYDGNAGIGGGSGGNGGDVAITGGSVTASTLGATGGDPAPQAIGHGAGNSVSGSLAINGMKVFDGAEATNPVAAADRESVCRSNWARLEICTEHAYDMQGTCLFCGLGGGPISYLDPTRPDSPVQPVPEFMPLVGTSMEESGWYVVLEDMQIWTRVEVAGDVHLLLFDGTELMVTNGFHVAGTNSLTVWAQSTDTNTAGKLTVPTSVASAASIGGNCEEAGGTVTINGGVLTVISGGELTVNEGAGIGGGQLGAGGTITIAGGTVTVIGGSFAAGIGGGRGGDGGNITIAGGTVTASGGGQDELHGPSSGAGIGGGSDGNGGNITIAGGTVTATGGEDGAGIGGGHDGSGGTITINGGTVTANGGKYGSGIGGGERGDAGTITIDGGSVTANGGKQGAGIGGGQLGAGGTITIDGGTVVAIGGEQGAGIGGGHDGSGGTITINGGTVTATAGANNAQAIGHGRDGDAGTLAIDGMRVFASAEATVPVAAAARVDTCHSTWAKVEVCPHGGESSLCPWCGVVPAYFAWAATNGISGAWNAKDADGIPNVFRYLFNHPTNTFDDPPLLSLEFDTDGHLLAKTPQVMNTNGFDFSLSAVDAPAWSSPTNHPLSPSGSTPLTNEPPPASSTRFFRLQATPSE